MRESKGVGYSIPVGTENELRELRKILKKSDHVSVLTGAGISAESGVPTFRGDGGLWKNHRATDLATPEAFDRDPELVWEFYHWRRNLISRVTYNPAHSALVALERLVPQFTLITQNVDGLHLLAGSQNLLEIHIPCIKTPGPKGQTRCRTQPGLHARRTLGFPYP